MTKHDLTPPPIHLTRDEMVQQLRDKGVKLPDNLPAPQLEDLYRNRFHGVDLPFGYEAVIDGKLVALWKAPRPEEQTLPEPPADEEAPEA